MVKRLLMFMILGLLAVGSTAWAGENADVTISFDLEKKADVAVGDQGNGHIMNVGPDEAVVLSIYGHGLSNLKAYTIDLKFEPDLVSYVNGGALRISPMEFDVFLGAGLSGTAVFAVIEDMVGGAVAVVPPPPAETAPDGDGFLAWLEFTTSAEFTTATIATFSLDKGVLIGVDSANDEVQVKPNAYLNTTAVEPTSWGQIKILFE